MQLKCVVAIFIKNSPIEVHMHIFHCVHGSCISLDLLKTSFHMNSLFVEFDPSLRKSYVKSS